MCLEVEVSSVSLCCHLGPDTGYGTLIYNSHSSFVNGLNNVLYNVFFFYKYVPQ